MAGCLYNKYSRDIKNKFKKHNCWVEIAAKFDITPEAAEKRFKNIRTAYGRYLKKKRNVPSGSGRDAVPRIPKEFENFEWLSTIINHRKTTSNFKPSSVVLDGDDSICSDDGDMVEDELDLTEKDTKESADETIDFDAIADETEIQIARDNNILPPSCENRENIKRSGNVDDQNHQSSEKIVKSTSKKKQGTNIKGGKQTAPKQKVEKRHGMV